MVCLDEQKKRLELSGSAEYTINAQCTIYLNYSREILKGVLQQAKGTVQMSPFRSDDSKDNQTVGWTS
jgi:hypothetical protein